MDDLIEALADIVFSHPKVALWTIALILLGGSGYAIWYFS